MLYKNSGGKVEPVPSEQSVTFNQGDKFELAGSGIIHVGEFYDTDHVDPDDRQVGRMGDQLLLGLLRSRIGRAGFGRRGGRHGQAE